MRLKVKGWKRHPIRTVLESAGVAVLMTLGKIDFKPKKFTRNQESPYMFIRVQYTKKIHQVQTFQYIVPGQQNIRRIEGRNRFTVTVGNFKTPLKNGESNQKEGRESKDLHTTMDTCRILYPATEHTFFSSAQFKFQHSRL